MPNPKWWKDLLVKQSKDHPEVTQIRLCFGHSGGGESFFGVQKFQNWSRDVAELCRRYPNIYCEVGCLDEIFDPKKNAAFVRSMDEPCHLPIDNEHKYFFGSKIMYGSDWFMAVASGIDRKDFLARYQQVFLRS
jgi:hypothetical protein